MNPIQYQLPDCSKFFFPSPTIQGGGNRNAKLLILIECPSQVINNHTPLGGNDFFTVSTLLQKAGMNITECYVTSVIKNRPPGGDMGVCYDDKKRQVPNQYLIDSLNYLHKEIQELNPNVVLCLGPESFKALSPYKNLNNWRGSVIPGSNYKIVGSYSPAQIYVNFIYQYPAQNDFIRAVQESKTPTYNYKEPTCILFPSFSQTMLCLDEIQKSEMFSFDIETIGPLIRCLGFCWDHNKSICIPFFTKKIQPNQNLQFKDEDWHLTASGKTVITNEDLFFNMDQSGEYHNFYTEEEEEKILQKLHELFLSPNKKIAQNMSYDVPVLANQFGFEFKNLWMDTLKAHHTLYPELPKGLDFLGSMYTDVPYWSDYSHSDDEALFKYNCLDTIVTFRCAKRFEQMLKQQNLHEVYFNHDHPALLAYLQISFEGLHVDIKERSKILDSCRGKQSSALEQLKSITKIDTFNPGSPLQVKKYLYETLRLPPILKRGTEYSETTDVHAIRALKDQYPQHNDFFSALLTYRENTKLIGTYLEKELTEECKIYSSLNSSGTVTRRLSSSEMSFTLGLYYPSTNLQNQPAEDWFKKIYVTPSDKYYFIKADLSQAEFRIVCWLANITRLINRYAEDPPYVDYDPNHQDFDVHRWVASMIFNKPQDLISKDERSLAKNGVYGGNYEMSAMRASQVYQLPLKTAAFILSKYRQVIPEIPKWWEKVREQVRKTRMIIDPFGCRRLFMDRINDDTFREAFSQSAQGIVAGITNRAAPLIRETFNRDECLIINQVHDEFNFYCLKEKFEYYTKLIQSFLQYPIYFVGIEKPLIIPVEVSYGPSWGEQTKYKYNSKVQLPGSIL